MVHIPESEQRVKFYQTGTYTVGNRLLDDAQRSVQATLDRSNSLDSGHRACQGCGEALGARYAIDAAMRATDNQLVAANATGCLEVFTTPYPETAWSVPWIHSLFGNAAAVAAGIAAAHKAKGREDCSKESGCICTRQEKHVMWKIQDKQSFAITFDQGTPNPFVTKGQSDCNFKSNKKGHLRCRVKGKDVPRGDYKYTISVPECPSIQSHIKIY